MFDFLEASDYTEQWLMIGIKFRVYRVCELPGTFKTENNLTAKDNGEGKPWGAAPREVFRSSSFKHQWMHELLASVTPPAHGV